MGTCLSEALITLLRNFAESDSESSGEEDLDLDEDGDEVAQRDRAQPEDREDRGREVRHHREERARNIDIIDEVVEGPRVDAFVEMARRPCKSLSSRCLMYFLTLVVSDWLSSPALGAWGLHTAP